MLVTLTKLKISLKSISSKLLEILNIDCYKRIDLQIFYVSAKLEKHHRYRFVEFLHLDKESWNPNLCGSFGAVFQGQLAFPDPRTDSPVAIDDGVVITKSFLTSLKKGVDFEPKYGIDAVKLQNILN